ncbi:hypothetical protein PHYPSEUDO_003738 [Phytophthora pseudosyringae]|uniref:Ankyrin repeat-containing domain n=1 Tax=Phytophthora pseudosyringae TaxID=221518 RepID=A0A8T1VT07_9STRA|nr:hypothetical protein PHYPSEUDO_003738 [Phytophthora pseudosyringae]
MEAAAARGDIDLVALVMRITRLSPATEVLQAAAHGHIELLEWMEEQIPQSEMVGALMRAAENGHLNVVQWLIERDWNDEDLDSSDSDSDSDDWDGGYGYNGWGGRRERTRPTHITSVGGEACLDIHAAAINGHLEVAKYLHARVDRALTRDDEKDERKRRAKTVKSLARRLGESNNAAMVSGATMVLAAKNGFLHVVQWLHDEFSVDTTMDLYEDYNIREEKVDTAMDMAASHGHLAVLQYLHEIGKSFRATPKRQRTSSIDSLYEFFSGPAKVLKTIPPKCTTAAMNGAAAHGRLDIVC